MTYKQIISLIKNILLVIVFTSLGSSVSAVTYWVSPTGDDANDGLDSTTAWASIGHGDSSGVLVAGDTINILQGTYNISNMITLSTSGDISGYITYRKFGLADVYIDGGNIVDTIIQITGNYTKLLGIILLNSGGDVISLDADSCEISGCKVYDYIYQGVDITGSNNLIYKNIFSRTTQSGVVIRAGAENNFVYGNTINDCPYDGIWISPSVTTTRIFNNIIVSAGDGIDGSLGNICGYNNIWNSISNDYANGIVDSSGGISVDPLFTNTAGDDYSLQALSLCIDAGVDLGYSYDGSAPDMGAIEYSPNMGTVYWVSPTGDDANDGLDSTTAWASIDRGEQLAILVPGDTINILSGTYSLFETIILTTSGTSADPIVYQAYQTNDINGAIVDLNNTTKPVFQLEGNHTELLGVSSTNADQNGIVVLADSCVVAYCKIFNVTKRGIRIYGSYNLIFKNLCYNVGWAGIKNENNGNYNLFYNNTVYSNDGNGINIDVGVFTSRIINNIITENGNKGISSNVENVCAYNNVLGNSGGDYVDGAVDSAGGISADPLFVNTVTGDFSLQSGSPCIDAGIDLGYAFNGSAPDMGAIEFTPAINELPILTSIGAKAISENLNLNFSVSATDVESIPTLATSTLPTGASFVDNNDGSGSFDWTPTFVQSGDYDITFYATDDSAAIDSEIVTITVNNVDRSPVLSAIGPQTVEEGQNLNFTITASDSDGTIPNLTANNIPTNASFIDNNDGTGSLGFNPDYIQEGIYNVTFIANSTGLADTEIVEITVTPAPITYIDVTPLSVAVEELTSQQYTAQGFDAGSTLVRDLTDSVTWTTTDPSGGILPTGIYTAGNNISPPDYYVKAVYQGILSDSGTVTVNSTGLLSYIQIEHFDGTPFGDTTLATDNDSTTLYCRGYDSGDNLIGDVTGNWSIFGVDTIGVISPIGGTSTTLEINNSGISQITVVKASTYYDTTGFITAQPGTISRLTILPDSVVMKMNDTIQFTAIGYDVDSNVTNTGTLIWQANGRIGFIDSNGLFIASAPGNGAINVTSSLSGLADTTVYLDVQELYLTTLPIGNSTVSPGSGYSSILAFNIENYYDTSKTITSIQVRSRSSGLGTYLQQLDNIDSCAVYLDANKDSLLSPLDNMLGKIDYTDTIISIPITPVIIQAGTSEIFIVAVSLSMTARDGDTLDFALNSTTDIQSADASPIIGPVESNSFGLSTVDGLISEQISLIPTMIDTIASTDTIVNVLTCDIPRNGYSSDILQVFSIVNTGTALENDIDSLVLYQDNGNLIWENIQDETKIGILSFTGDRWTRSGISVPLTTQTTRFFVVAFMNQYPKNNATISLTIPQYGLDMISFNDGPIDKSLDPVDTILIVTDEKLEVKALDISPRELIPGQQSNPLLNISFSNTYSSVISFDSIRFDYQSIDLDSATQNQLDGQIDTVKLYLQLDGKYDDISIDDSLIAQAFITNGEVLFTTNNLTVPANRSSFVLSVVADLNLSNCKDGNSIAFVLPDSMNIYSNQIFKIDGIFPIENSNQFIVNSFSSSAVTINPVVGGTIYGGQNNQLVLDIVLPANGYTDDTLQSLKIQNVGSQDDNEAVQAIKLWIDIDGNGFSATDRILGTFSNLGTYWEISGLLQTIPVGGERLFVTIDIFDKNFTGGTLQYEIITQGCLYRSGMLGPDDTVIRNPYEDIVFPSDRITVISIPGTEEMINPGALDKTILTFALYNGYVDRSQTLQSVGLINISHSLSSADYSDFELGFVSIYFDKDGSTTLNETTPIANGRFINGKLQLSGLNVTLPSEELSYFFVVSALPLSLIDSDSLAISIESPSDFIFTENVNLNGTLPLRQGNYFIVDGSTVSQYLIHQVPPTTLSPGDTSVPLLAFSPAINGDLGDILDSVKIENVETADNTDISSLDLWLDINNDSIFQQTDSLLGTFNYSTNMWKIGGLSLPIDTIAPVLIITGDVSLSAIPDKAFKAKIPVNGCFYLSGNDGPNDLPIIGENTFTISASNLRIKTSQLKQAYSVGETIEVRFTATNLSASTLNNVFGRISNISDSLAVSFDSSYGGAVSLGVGQSKDFVYYYTANLVSELNWEMVVVAMDINDSSSIVSTPLVQIQSSPSDVPVVLINSIPTAVTKGQSNVFPLSLTISHPDSLSSSAPIQIDSLFLTIETESGQPQLASDVFNRIVFTADYTNLTIIDNVPALSKIPLYFKQPVVIQAGEQQNFSLLVDIDSNATATDLVFAISDSNAIPIVDNNNNMSVSIDPLVLFPLKTASCRIDAPSQKMELAYKSVISSNANFGQQDFDLAGFILKHPGNSNSSQIQLTSLSFEVLDEFDNPINISDIIERVKIRRQLLVVADQADSLNTALVQLQLNSPITLNPGESDSIVIMATIKNSSTVSAFKIRISDSTSFIVRDLSSGANITVTADTASLATSNLFPVVTSTTNLKIAAESPQFCYNTTLPPTVITGRDSLSLASFSLQYPYSALYSPVVLKSVLVYVLDSLEKPLDPTQLFDRIGYKLNSASTIQYQPYILLSSGAVLFEFNTDGILLNPGDSVDLTLFGDIEADVPYDHFRLMVNESSSFSFVDQTDSTSLPALMFTDNCYQTFPIQTTISAIISPAGRPLIEALESNITNAFIGQQNVPIFSTTLYYDRESSQGDLLIASLEGLITKHTLNGYISYSGDNLFTNLRLMVNGNEAVIDSTFSNDSLFLSIDSGLSVKNGDIVDITVLADLKADAPVGNYRIQFKDSTFIDIEDLQLATKIYPILMSGSYPILSTELSLTQANLKESFSNYPNPFGIENDETTITFVLSDNGVVDIELFTLTGQSVLKLVNSEHRAAGVYNSDKWSGKNTLGMSVIPGTYFCRITVKYDSGKEETELRKISVIR